MKKRNILLIPCVILSAAFAFVSAACIMLSNENSRLRLISESKETLPPPENEETLPPPETAATEPVPPEPVIQKETIYIYDNGIDSMEYPLLPGVSLNDYDMELLNISEDKRRALYNENGEKRSKFGIDVSSHQGRIDWSAVANDDVEFAFIRLGYRGYETGRIVEDTYFRDNISGCVDSGIETGVYFFSQAITPEEAVEEAEFVLNALSDCGAEITLPIVFDWEFPSDEDPARTDDLSGEIQTDCCRAFCARIREAGYDAAYYSTINTAFFRYDLTELEGETLWLAEYSEATEFPYEFAVWQYSSSGEIDGIEAFTDLNLMFTD